MMNNSNRPRRRLSEVIDLDTVGQMAWLFFIVSIFALAATSLPR